MSDERWSGMRDDGGVGPMPGAGGPPAQYGAPPNPGAPYGYPAAAGPVLYPLDGAWSWSARPRRRTGLWIGIGLGAVALVGVGVAGWMLVGSKLVPARSPEAAVQRLLDAAEGKDALAAYGVLSPAEVSLLRQGFAGMDPAAVPTPQEGAVRTANDALESVTVELDGAQLAPEAIGDGLAKVAFTAGTLTVDGDPQAIADAWRAAMDGMVASGRLPFGAADLDAGRDQLAQLLDEALPFTAAPAQDWQQGGEPPFLVVVHEGRGWYVSPLMTLGEYLVQSQGLARGQMPPATATGSDTPEAAGEAAARALVDLAMGDAGSLVGTLSTAESRFAAVYLEPLMAQPQDTGVESAEVTSARFEVLESDDSRAELGVDELALTFTADGETGTVTFDGDCFTVAPAVTESPVTCLSDVPLVSTLALGDTYFVAVRESDGWHVSLLASVANRLGAIAEGLARLADDGTLLDPQWWAEQEGALAGLEGTAAPAVQPSGATAMYYGDDPQLDALWDACAAGDAASCDLLYGSSPLDSEYAWFGVTCGGVSDATLTQTCVEQTVQDG